MYRALLLLFCTGACFAAQPSEEEVKKELKLFQGKWEAVGGQGFDGAVPTDAELQLTSLEVDGDKFTWKTGSLTVKGSFTVDPTKKPKHIDVFFGDGKDNAMRGIYEIKDGVRKACFAKPGKDRPKEFRKEKDYMINEWRSVK